MLLFSMFTKCCGKAYGQLHAESRTKCPATLTTTHCHLFEMLCWTIPDPRYDDLDFVNGVHLKSFSGSKLFKSLWYEQIKRQLLPLTKLWTYVTCNKNFGRLQSCRSKWLITEVNLVRRRLLCYTCRYNAYNILCRVQNYQQGLHSKHCACQTHSFKRVYRRAHSLQEANFPWGRLCLWCTARHKICTRIWQSTIILLLNDLSNLEC